MKRGIILSDLHCGHQTGLTPPAYQQKIADKFGKVQRSCWAEYRAILKRHEPYDFALVMGDCIDGTGHRSGGTETLEADRMQQAEMAADCLNTVRLHARKGFRMFGVYGTPYHSGEAEDFEQIVADKAGWEKIGSHEWFDVNGCIIDCKHKIGSSTVPHGRHTPIAKDRLWNLLWSSKQMQPKADVILRGHCHYYNFCGGSDWIGITLPALQGLGTKYGSRQCSGTVDWGAVVCEIDNKGRFSWTAEVVEIAEQRATAIKI